MNLRHLGALAVTLLATSCWSEPPAAQQVDQSRLTKHAVNAAIAESKPIGAFHLDANPQQGGLVRGILPPGATRLTKDGAPVTIAPDGHFIIGFGRDAAATSVLAATLNGNALTQTISVAKRQWRIENLSTLARFSQPAPEFMARRKGELEQINAARAKWAVSEGWRQAFIWPAKGRISGVFGSQRIYRGEPGAPHNGVDVAAPVGTAVVAPADGVVILAASAPFTLEGNLLMLDHGMGLNSAFLHLSRIDVKPGQSVRQGQVIGAIGMTGRTIGPHLHWGLRWADERLDPALVAGPMR